MNPAVHPARPRKTSPRLRTITRWMFHTHLWLGVVVGFLVIVIALTGILLNHKRALGFMPGSDLRQPDAFARALPLPELARLAGAAVAPAVAATGIDRMDVRPDAGIIKVRFNDSNITEVTLAVHDGRLLVTGLRNDSFLEKLHSGDIFGKRGFLLSDFAAGAMIVLLASGFWMWLYPRTRIR